MHVSTSVRSFLRGLAASSFFAACLAACSIDYLVGNVLPLSKMTTYGLHRSEPYLAAEAYRKLKQAPDVVLVGSSLLLAPVMQSETMRQGKALDRKRYRRSTVMEEALRRTQLTDGRVFNFAVGGCMFSDAYLITRRVLEQKAPPVIILGIAPRDAQDSNVPGVEITETFKCLSEPEDALTARQITGRDALVSRVDLLLASSSNLWRYRGAIVPYAQLRMKKLMEKTLPWVAFVKRVPTGWIEVKGFKFMEEIFAEPIAYPGMELEHKSRAETNVEYAKRYNPVCQPMVDEQIAYLDKLAQLCQRRNTQLIVVNMPLSRTNQKLMTDGFYDNFTATARKICRQRNAEFVDWSRSKWTDNESHFADGVHLSAAVSEEFVNDLAQLLRAPRVAASLKHRIASSPALVQ